VSNAKVAVSIHRASDGSAGARVAAPGRVAAARRTALPNSDGRIRFAAALVTLVAFGIYLRTVMPGAGFWDTGEAQTVPATLSIFHPTGFPTYAMLGWLWSQLPIGEVAFRMNLLSAVCVALTAGLVVLITAHLVEERHRGVAAAAAGIGGFAFAFAAEPWENATRADVHAVNVLFVALITWLCFSWAAAERAGAPRADRWLMSAALAFGLGIGTHPLVGLLAVAIGPWLFIVDRRIWRRWPLLAVCAGLLLVGLASYLYIPIRAALDPEPPLFYARPDTIERLRYLIFAEQFRGLFDDFGAPLANFAGKWQFAEGVLARQYVGPGWLVVAIGASTLAVRRPGSLAFLAISVVADVIYAMNFRDGDIDRYYMPAVVMTAPLIGIAVGAIAAAAGRASAQLSRRAADVGGRRRLATAAGALVLVLGSALPAASVVTLYRSHDQSQNREAERWVASVHSALPANAVIISWWSYSTPLWYARWILGERPDVTIIDERTILDEGYRTMSGAIREFLGDRPVYVVPPHWEREGLLERWRTRSIPTYPGYTDLLLIEGRQ